jgi:thymidylate kinase
LLAENYEDGIFNKNIIYDRTPISMIIHQATSISLFNNIHLEDYLNVYLKGMNLLFDFNKIVYIKTPLDICLTRILKLDRYKNMTDKHKEHFELMYHSFDKILNQYEKKVLKIDGNKNNINEDIKNIQNFFNSD